MAVSLILAGVVPAQSAEELRAVIDRLGREADRFERAAHRVMAIETLRQTVPDGVRVGRGPRGIQTALPGYTREIVSEYGFISLDEPGGSLKEVRNVLTIDGQRWNKPGRKNLGSLAEQLTAATSDAKRRQLERFEEHGLEGFATDFGQLILLFARGNTTNYEFVLDKVDDEAVERTAIYNYRQLDGPQALTIYEGKEVIRQRLEGKIWIRARDRMPVKISLDSTRSLNGSAVRDTAEVFYDAQSFEFLYPWRVVHRQFVDGREVVKDEFEYGKLRELFPRSSR
jgi:hypothetical protein